MFKRNETTKTFGNRKIVKKEEKEVVGLNSNFIVDEDGKTIRID